MTHRNGRRSAGCRLVDSSCPACLSSRDREVRFAAALDLHAVVDDNLENCLDVAALSNARPILVSRTTKRPAREGLKIEVVTTIEECLNALLALENELTAARWSGRLAAWRPALPPEPAVAWPRRVLSRWRRPLSLARLRAPADPARGILNARLPFGFTNRALGSLCSPPGRQSRPRRSRWTRSSRAPPRVLRRVPQTPVGEPLHHDVFVRPAQLMKRRQQLVLFLAPGTRSAVRR